MPAIEGTLTPDDVAAWLGVPPSDRVVSATDAARSWAINRRSLSDPGQLFYNPDVHHGAMLYAGLLVQARSTPSGFAGYDEAGGSAPQTLEALYRARDLVGSDPVTA